MSLSLWLLVSCSFSLQLLDKQQSTSTGTTNQRRDGHAQRHASSRNLHHEVSDGALSLPLSHHSSANRMADARIDSALEAMQQRVDALEALVAAQKAAMDKQERLLQGLMDVRTASPLRRDASAPSRTGRSCVDGRCLPGCSVM